MREQPHRVLTFACRVGADRSLQMSQWNKEEVERSHKFRYQICARRMVGMDGRKYGTKPIGSEQQQKENRKGRREFTVYGSTSCLVGVRSEPQVYVF